MSLEYAARLDQEKYLRFENKIPDTKEQLKELIREVIKEELKYGILSSQE